MSPRMKKKLAIALLLVTIILITPPAQASPCSESCDFEFNLCMAYHADCNAQAYYNYYNCLQVYPPGSGQDGVCNYFYWLDTQTCDQVMYDCNFTYDLCLTSCQYQ